eukprot:CAMPEP_0118881994 /NCGR_PEP_ID=MMETSP1163-20130328/21332_1 /TAXON_ID=124430 /ORGANISM="Phaeomonas parva, Strain CCMP2877" /LENGTH=213 /DNA_ID=CAMNT_0006818933 /DNA_START=127 /DNA_END=768 /DNA_ORIENTATION=-
MHFFVRHFFFFFFFFREASRSSSLATAVRPLRPCALSSHVHVFLRLRRSLGAGVLCCALRRGVVHLHAADAPDDGVGRVLDDGDESDHCAEEADDDEHLDDDAQHGPELRERRHLQQQQGADGYGQQHLQGEVRHLLWHYHQQEKDADQQLRAHPGAAAELVASILPRPCFLLQQRRFGRRHGSRDVLELGVHPLTCWRLCFNDNVMYTVVGH